MILYDANAPGCNPVTVRHFILEREGLSLEVEHIDLANLANREPNYLENVNSRGEVPALRLDNGTIITETTAICAYLDEVAASGTSLFGNTPEERAETNMWVRRVYLEICSPLLTWWRGTEDAVQFYKSHRVPATDAQEWMRGQTHKGLERLNIDLEGRVFIANGKLTMADILLNAFLITLLRKITWADREDLTNLMSWRNMMASRPSSKAMLDPLPHKIG
ncbi:glutathione S-transferase family protein [Curvivirga aplysinae]|uniref:glutathione S-transferase family protein n=1 Tax=Curvivirga aplysinae TaxID=2529852 RepID=UPI0012BC41E1|nr:glutathione S-transferase family protein [Curvivirga aplysinae]MTI09850.1 glutathione S-transferase family protein [Curvivirga aplysinae]